jgi:hypothetical protein
MQRNTTVAWTGLARIVARIYFRRWARVMNKRVFTFMDALDMIDKQNLMHMIKASGEVLFPPMNAKRHVGWDDQPAKGEKGADLKAYPTDAEMERAWTAGVKKAEEHLLSDGTHKTLCHIQAQTDAASRTVPFCA